MRSPGNSERPRASDAALESGSFDIVELTANDWQEVKELRLQALKNAPRAFGQTYEEGMHMTQDEWVQRFSTGRYFGARMNGKLVGMLCLVRERGEKVEHIANVYSVYVAPEARRLGVGTALFERVLREVADGNTRKLRLRVDATNEAAKGLYESMGFQQVGVLRDELRVDDEYVDELVMEKYFE